MDHIRSQQPRGLPPRPERGRLPDAMPRDANIERRDKAAASLVLVCQMQWGQIFLSVEPLDGAVKHSLRTVHDLSPESPSTKLPPSHICVQNPQVRRAAEELVAVTGRCDVTFEIVVKDGRCTRIKIHERAPA